MPDRDFILTWDWVHDAEFIKRFNAICTAENIKADFISPSNIHEINDLVISGKIKYKVLLDRASDTDAAFDPLIDQIILSGTRTLNEARHSMKAIDKATMHIEFLAKGIDVPNSIIYYPKQDFKLEEKDLRKLGKPFIIKPAFGGGGEGVIEGNSLQDIKDIKNVHSEERYLLQEKVFPAIIDGKRAYFRIFYICGYIIPCWWDNETHIFDGIVNKAEEKQFSLKTLKDFTRIIADISKLDFFSTEICLLKGGRFVAVDYVNDPCDMRPRETCVDGVPEDVLNRIIMYLIDFIKHAKKEELTPLRKEFIKKRRDFELKLLRRYR